MRLKIQSLGARKARRNPLRILLPLGCRGAAVRSREWRQDPSSGVISLREMRKGPGIASRCLLLLPTATRLLAPPPLFLQASPLTGPPHFQYQLSYFAVTSLPSSILGTTLLEATLILWIATFLLAPAPWHSSFTSQRGAAAPEALPTSKIIRFLLLRLKGVGGFKETAAYRWTFQGRTPTKHLFYQPVMNLPIHH